MTTIRFRRRRVQRLRRLALPLLAAVAASLVAASAAGAAVAPANTALPTVSGTLVVGSTLTAAAGTWSGDAPITFTYQWQHCDAAAANCADISGAVATTYVLAPLDSGATFRVAVTGTNTAGGQTVNSAATAVVANAPGAPANTTLPAIAGTPVVGATLTATTGAWSGTLPLTFTSAWRRCDAAGAFCQTVAGASGLTYAVTDSDLGHTLRFEVGATNVAGAAKATSDQTAVVIAPAAPAAKPSAKQQCKRGGWRTFTSPGFRNQGQCIRSIVAASLGHGNGPSSSQGSSSSSLGHDDLKGKKNGHAESHGKHGGSGDDD